MGMLLRGSAATGLLALEDPRVAALLLLLSSSSLSDDEEEEDELSLLLLLEEEEEEEDEEEREAARPRTASVMDGEGGLTGAVDGAGTITGGGGAGAASTARLLLLVSSLTMTTMQYTPSTFCCPMNVLSLDATVKFFLLLRREGSVRDLRLALPRRSRIVWMLSGRRGVCSNGPADAAPPDGGLTPEAAGEVADSVAVLAAAVAAAAAAAFALLVVVAGLASVGCAALWQCCCVVAASLCWSSSSSRCRSTADPDVGLVVHMKMRGERHTK